MERACSASDRLDTRREAEVTVWCVGRETADGEAEERRRRAPMGSARGPVWLCQAAAAAAAAWHKLRKWSCNR